MDIFLIEVFYLNPDDGWMAIKCDEEGYQIGEGMTSYRKKWALEDAKLWSGGSVPINVFGRDGKLQRVLNE